jgi:hypothetical protein
MRQRLHDGLFQHCFRLSILVLESVQYVELVHLSTSIGESAIGYASVPHTPRVYSCAESSVALSRSEVYHISFQFSFNCTAPLDS